MGILRNVIRVMRDEILGSGLKKFLKDLKISPKNISKNFEEKFKFLKYVKIILKIHR